MVSRPICLFKTLLSVFFFFICQSFTEVQLVYNVIASAVQQSDSGVHVHTFTLFQIFSHTDYPRILGKVPCIAPRLEYHDHEPGL